MSLLLFLLSEHISDIFILFACILFVTDSLHFFQEVFLSTIKNYLEEKKILLKLEKVPFSGKGNDCSCRAIVQLS